VCVCSRYTFIYTCVCLCTPFGLILRTRWIAFWQPLNLHVQTLELGPWWIFSIADQSSTAEAWIIGKLSEDLSSSPSYSALEILCCYLWASFVLFIFVYLLINHTFAPLGDVIFMYIGSRSVIKCTCTLPIGMYIIIILSYSDSCLYWCLVYICEGIFTLRVSVTLTSLYRGIGVL